MHIDVADAELRRGRGIGGRGAPIPLPGAGLAKGRVQAGHCRQSLSCRRLAREFEGMAFASFLRSTVNIIRIVESDAGDGADAGFCPPLIDAVTAWH